MTLQSFNFLQMPKSGSYGMEHDLSSESLTSPHAALANKISAPTSLDTSLELVWHLQWLLYPITCGDVVSKLNQHPIIVNIVFVYTRELIVIIIQS